MNARLAAISIPFHGSTNSMRESLGHKLSQILKGENGNRLAALRRKVTIGDWPAVVVTLLLVRRERAGARTDCFRQLLAFGASHPQEQVLESIVWSKEVAFTSDPATMDFIVNLPRAHTQSEVDAIYWRAIHLSYQNVIDRMNARGLLPTTNLFAPAHSGDPFFDYGFFHRCQAEWAAIRLAQEFHEITLGAVPLAPSLVRHGL